MHTAELILHKPSYFEVEADIGNLKRYKSPGADQIPAEMIQTGSNTLHSEIHKFINSIWSKEELPQQWKVSIIVPIYKKNDKTDCSNFKEYHYDQLHTKVYPVFVSDG
jgi:hypothetical protein